MHGYKYMSVLVTLLHVQKSFTVNQSKITFGYNAHHVFKKVHGSARYGFTITTYISDSTLHRMQRFSAQHSLQVSEAGYTLGSQGSYQF